MFRISPTRCRKRNFWWCPFAELRLELRAEPIQLEPGIFRQRLYFIAALFVFQKFPLRRKVSFLPTR